MELRVLASHRRSFRHDLIYVKLCHDSEKAWAHIVSSHSFVHRLITPFPNT